ncbi:MAG TPA: chemotaxis protein CheA [Terracidiphilus sp.]|nr:chemotaxis protein CheA [Terracidiphilus sp.]
MSDPNPIGIAEQRTIESLRSHIDNVAVQIVLGTLAGRERLELLRSLREEAERCGQQQVVQIIDAAITAASTRSDDISVEGISSDCLLRVQQALSGPRQDSVLSPALPEARSDASAAVPLAEDRELIGDFILEARDHLAQVEQQMITLEKDPSEAEAINTVFRAFHTIKGLAGFLSLDAIREIAHETETLLDLARNHRLTISPAIVDVVLAASDFLKASLTQLEQRSSGGQVRPAPEKEGLLVRIRRASSGAFNEESRATETPGKDRRGITSNAEAPGDPNNCWNGVERRAGEDRRVRVSEAHCVKVDTAKLDYLVDMAGEMVIAESMVRHHPELAGLRSPAVLNSLAQLARITSDLQKTAMSMRMVPIGGLFQKMNRLVRDLARKTGKQVELEAIGSETELDRNVVEELADPLMHMVRNAIDHGLETDQERLAMGKNPIGVVRLRASHQAGYIVIEIADDGRGVNREKILEKAHSTGLIDGESSLADDDVFQLIFHPGFSTAAEVTDVSGRGVGMDVVKKKIQKLRGQIEIESSPNRGTSFLLRMPLTLAIIDGLVVGVGRERYVVPIFSVREMLRPSAEMVFTVEGRQEMVLVRNNLMPLVRLYRRFGVEPRSEEPTESLVIVAEVGGRSFCLMVDDLVGKQEVVIKTLGETMKDIPGVAGGAILGDGRIGLILDLEGIFRGVAR